MNLSSFSPKYYLDPVQNFVHGLEALVLVGQLLRLVFACKKRQTAVHWNKDKDDGHAHQEGQAQLVVQEVESQGDLLTDTDVDINCFL